MDKSQPDAAFDKLLDDVRRQPAPPVRIVRSPPGAMQIKSVANFLRLSASFQNVMFFYDAQL